MSNTAERIAGLVGLLILFAFIHIAVAGCTDGVCSMIRTYESTKSIRREFGIGEQAVPAPQSESVFGTTATHPTRAGVGPGSIGAPPDPREDSPDHGRLRYEHSPDGVERDLSRTEERRRRIFYECARIVAPAKRGDHPPRSIQRHRPTDLLRLQHRQWRNDRGTSPCRRHDYAVGCKSGWRLCEPHRRSYWA
jgi:hypothetical protein